MKNHSAITEIKVGLNFGTDTIPVGRLAMRDRKIYFEYDRAFIERGLDISPLRLPLKSGVTSFDSTLFEGLPGVFNDSLPDGWGRLLFDRFARSHGLLPSDLTPMDRLAHVGAHGMGALVYEPDHSTHDTNKSINLDKLAKQAQDVLDGASDDVLQELLALNGSSAGARPKALIGIDAAKKNIIHGTHDLPSGYAPWIVKFANTQDGGDAGAIEYVYALMARDAGLAMPDVYLFPAQKGSGYFAVKRFDREGKRRFHMHTACGLLHSDFRTPSLDYEDLIALTGVLTRDVREVEKMAQLAIFNVLSHNRDDHAKNFSFLMDEMGEWKLSPAYDITFSSGPNGEQSTMVMGEGRNPGIDNLINLGSEAKLPKSRIMEMIDQTQAALAKWAVLAEEHGVSADNIDLIGKRINAR
jgi:serine/threonine-protein kinase HipA